MLNKSVTIADERAVRMDTMSQLSNNNRTKSAYNAMKPASPKVEKEILSQLDELKSELSGWLQKIEQKKNVSPDKFS